MVLAIDIGNTNIVIGIFENDAFSFKERISTDTSKTDLEYVVEFQALLNLYDIDKKKIDGAVISSVVPPLNNVINSVVYKMFGVKALMVGPGIKTGLNLAVDNPASVGADLIVDSVAGLKDYGAPLILIDMGTATTVTVVDKDGSFIGGMILPGARVSLDSLVNRTSQLPTISIEPSKNVVGKNTVDCMKSGIVNGQAAMLDGLIDKINNELGYNCKVVAAGGLVSCIVPHCSHEIIIDDELTLRGLKYIYEKNK